VSGWLETILTSKRREVERLREAPIPIATRQVTPVVPALRGHAHLKLIAEVKFKSPSAGELVAQRDAGSRASAYARAGAAMVSVLCDGPFFGGSYRDVAHARAALDAMGATIPILAKEYILDPIQLAHARAAGADAALLIVRILPDLGRLLAECRSVGLEPFVEVASQGELRRALDSGATVIGVNARDLDTLRVDASLAEEVLASIPSDRTAVHLSGLRTAEDVARIAGGRADAALIGEALMRDNDPSALLKRMLAAASR
jgi:indole-3-glycerol phosphate synthase